MNKLITVAMVAAIACGCVSVHKNDGGTDTLRPKVVKDAVYEKYTIGETPVKAKATAVGICGFIIVGDPDVTHVADDVDSNVRYFGSAAVAKNGAYSKACEENDCDAIVGARYKVKRTNYVVYDQSVVEITGYPAKLEGVELLKAPKACCAEEK